ncbi:hypothetical protein RRG08_038320 [Elysia crispata]|uniref:Uncharacterized protein n=1 Tax=Elysia crispata TaxID=231223 RepID=A0AAE1E263_9GAST|nr:hypothetical protein RRG08_038320 [Elysia crispata]
MCTCRFPFSLSFFSSSPPCAHWGNVFRILGYPRCCTVFLCRVVQFRNGRSTRGTGRQIDRADVRPARRRTERWLEAICTRGLLGCLSFGFVLQIKLE